MTKPDVYIHIKGFSLAKVTHLDVESEELNKILKPKEVFQFSFSQKFQLFSLSKILCSISS